jgi:hypothetical protein
MDPKQLAKEILENLFENNDEVYEDDLYEEEEKDEEDEDEGEDEGAEDSADDADESEDEGEDEDYGDEDEGEDEGDDESQSMQSAPQGASKTGGLASTLANKPSWASPQMPMGGVPSAGNDLEADAHGGTAHDATGKGFQLGTKQTVGYAPNQAASTLQMKPSFAQASMPGVQREQLENDVRVMFGGDEDLSEEFVSKAASLYEAAVVTKVSQIAESLRVELAEQFEEKILSVKSTLEEQLDTYLNYVVEEWMKENEIAIENGLRTEIAENFMGKLKDLFTESYIEVPQEKVSAFDEMVEAVDHLENRLNEEIEANAKLIGTIKTLKAQQIFTEATNNLTNMQAEQLRPLAENVQFESEQDYRSKIGVLVEGVVKTSSRKQLNESKKQTPKPLFERVVLEEETIEEEPEVPASMKVYYETINRVIKN